MPPAGLHPASGPAASKQAMARIGQTRGGLIEDALIVAAGAAVVMLATQPEHAD